MGRLWGFMQTDFLFQVGNKSKLIPSQKIKKRVKYTTIRALQAKAFENISFYDQCRPVHSAREVIKIKMALFMAQSIPSVPIPNGIFWALFLFFFFFRKSCKCSTVGPGVRTKIPRWGALKWGANASPRDNTKISFHSK